MSVSVEGGDIETPVGSAPIVAVVMMITGGYLMWFAVKYWRGTGPAVWPSYPIKSILQGNGLPAGQPAESADIQVTSWEETTGAVVAGGTATGQQIGTDAFRYQGQPYVWGGSTPAGIPNPKSSSGGWDCSGFVNWVIGHDLGQPIPSVPAGQFTGSEHGPVVASWLGWSGATRILTPQLGDLACWGPNEHMGICLSATQMISALDPALGTQVTPILSAHSGNPTYLRVAAQAPATPARKGKKR